MELNNPIDVYKPEGEVISRYVEARKEWDDRIGDARKQAYNWRLFSLSVVLVCLALVAGMAYLASKGTFIPYIIELGPNGEVVAQGRANNMNYTPQEREIKFFLAQEVKKVRSLPLDPVVARENWVSAYHFLRQAAAVKMNEYVRKDNALERIGQETVSVTIRAIVPSSKTTWQVRWTEDVFTREGSPKETRNMTGLFTIDFTMPATEAEIIRNPLGLYISDFSWSKEL